MEIKVPELNAPLDLPPNPLDFVIGEPVKQRAEPPKQDVAPAAPPPAPPPAQQPVNDAAFARLAQADKQAREAQAALQAAQARVAQLEQLEQLAALRDKPLELLAKLGVSFNDVANQYAETGSPPPEEIAKQQVRQLEQTVTARLQEFEKRETERQLAEERANIAHVVNSDERFAMTKLAGAHEMVWRTIQTHYNDTRELLSYEQAAEQVEAGIEKLVSAFLESPQVRARFKLAQEQRQEESREKPRVDMALSNSSASAPAALVPDPFNPVTASDDDLLSRLASQLRFK